jgi:hypothetical protein
MAENRSGQAATGRDRRVDETVTTDGLFQPPPQHNTKSDSNPHHATDIGPTAWSNSPQRILRAMQHPETASRPASPAHAAMVPGTENLRPPPRLLSCFSCLSWTPSPTAHRTPHTEHRTPKTENRKPNTENRTPKTNHQPPTTAFFPTPFFVDLRRPRFWRWGSLIHQFIEFFPGNWRSPSPPG